VLAAGNTRVGSRLVIPSGRRSPSSNGNARAYIRESIQLKCFINNILPSVNVLAAVLDSMPIFGDLTISVTRGCQKVSVEPGRGLRLAVRGWRLAVRGLGRPSSESMASRYFKSYFFM
jgi:hypothetical protein